MNFPKTRHRRTISPRPECKWPNPESSTGVYLQKMGRYHCWEAVGPTRDVFNQLADDINGYLKKNSNSVSCPVTWSLYMVGRTKETSKPTVTFVSREIAARRVIRKTIASSGILEKYTGFITMDCDRPPGFEKLEMLAGGLILDSIRLRSPDGIQLHISQSQIIGSAIFVHGRKVATAGGVLRWRKRYFIMTVAHPFFPDEKKNIFPDTDTSSEIEFDIDGLSDTENSSDMSTEITSRASITPEGVSSDDGRTMSHSVQNHLEVLKTWRTVKGSNPSSSSVIKICLQVEECN